MTYFLTSVICLLTSVIYPLSQAKGCRGGNGGGLWKLGLSQLCIRDMQAPYAQTRFYQIFSRRENETNKWNLH